MAAAAAAVALKSLVWMTKLGPELARVGWRRLLMDGRKATRGRMVPSERKAEPSWKPLLLLELRELYESPPTLGVPSIPLAVPHTSALHGWKAPRPPCLGCRHLVFRRICLTNEACPIPPGRQLLRGQAAGGHNVDSTVLAFLLGVLETGRPSKLERGVTQPVHGIVVRGPSKTGVPGIGGAVTCHWHHV